MHVGFIHWEYCNWKATTRVSEEVADSAYYLHIGICSSVICMHLEGAACNEQGKANVAIIQSNDMKISHHGLTSVLVKGNHFVHA